MGSAPNPQTAPIGITSPPGGGRWRRNAPRTSVFALFGVVALALLGAFVLIFATVEAERIQRSQAARTSAVLVALNGVVGATLNGETAQRGYFITYDKRYLAPYWRGQKAYETEIARVRSSLGAEATQQQTELVDEIERLGDAKWAEMGATVTLVARGEIAAAHARILSDEGQLAMDGLREAVGRLETVERARLADASHRAARTEARIVPLLSLLFAVIVCALALGLWQTVRMSRAEAAAANAEAIAEARDRADLLAKELNHRVKNLFAVILAVVKMSARGDTAAAPAVDRISKRIHALGTAHDVTQGGDGAEADSRVDLADLIGKTIAPYRSSGERCVLDGPALAIDGRHAMPLGLVLHEMVTNAVKYGAWARAGGLLEVRWQDVDGRVRLVWREESENAPPPPEGGKPEREGFGSMLMRSSARQLGGTIERRFETAGIVIEIDFPRVG
ncbi:sensor histidine kinase [Novosphingobium sp.]|uniref:sensor histidine kinase n=1 Tax=Novosphingobium sp. TaxID=1874826 RepID=UPI003529E69F